MEARKVKLYSITDGNESYYPEEWWWISVWAESESQALEFAKLKYTEREEPLKVAHSHDISGQPEVYPSEETRSETLRFIGWGYLEDEQSCCCCGLYAMGIEEHRVCGDCNHCKACADDGANLEKCDGCGN